MPEGVVEKQPNRAAVWTLKKQKEQAAARLIASIARSTARLTRFNSGAEICTLGSQRHLFSSTSHFWLYLPNAEMSLALEVNEVEVKGLISLASVTWITA